MFVPDPDGGRALFNSKGADSRLRLSKQYVDVITKLEADLKKRELAQASDGRMVVEAVNDAVNRLTGSTRAASANAEDADPLASMYNVGGM